MAYEPMFDFLKAKPVEGENEAQNNMRTISNERGLLAGATPMLIGLLAGDVSTGASVAGKALLDEDKRFQDQQSEYMKALAKKKEKSSEDDPYKHALVKVTLPDGKTVWKTRAEAHAMAPTGISTDQQIEKTARETKARTDIQRKSDIEKAKALNTGSTFGKDTITGEDVIRDRIAGTITPVRKLAPNELTPTQRKDLPELQKEFDKTTAKYRDVIDNSNEALNLLSTNPTGQQAAIFKIAKAIQGSGVLTDRDVDRLSGNRSATNILDQFFTKARTGALTQKNYDELIEVLDSIKKNASESISKRAKRFAKTRSEAFGRDLSPYLGMQEAEVSVGEEEGADVGLNIKQMTDQEIDERIRQLTGE